MKTAEEKSIELYPDLKNETYLLNNVDQMVKRKAFLEGVKFAEQKPQFTTCFGCMTSTECFGHNECLSPLEDLKPQLSKAAETMEGFAQHKSKAKLREADEIVNDIEFCRRVMARATTDLIFERYEHGKLKEAATNVLECWSELGGTGSRVDMRSFTDKLHKLEQALTKTEK